jgi:hypothetical protein
MLKIISFGRYQVIYNDRIFKKILFYILGKSNSLYRHDLLLLMQNKSTARLSLQLNKIQFQQKFEKLMPK